MNINENTQLIQDQIQLLEKKADIVDEFLKKHTSPCGFPVYTSMDVRDAGWKISAVDVNIFPAGWNNLTPRDSARATSRFRDFFERKLGQRSETEKWVLTLVPESHTSNLGYLENVYGLKVLLENAGAEVQLMWPGEPIPKPWVVKTLKGNTLEYLPYLQALEGSEAIILNHDLSGGIPKAIQSLNIPIFPSTRLGWFRRRKSNHQKIVDSLLEKLKETLDGFDPFYFSAKTFQIENVNFQNESSLIEISLAAESFLDSLKIDYQKRKIDFSPRIFLKNDSGTYGMGVLSLKDPQEIKEASRRMKNKMKVGKESVPITNVILQETIPTGLYYTTDQTLPDEIIAAEPVIYIVEGCPVGGFLRVHEKLGRESIFENLNQPGGSLEPVECPDAEGRPPRPFPKLRGLNTCQQLGTKQIYGFLARIHSVAAGLEDCLNESTKSSREATI
jgi:glutamate--cysteine ligase